MTAAVLCVDGNASRREATVEALSTDRLRARGVATIVAAERVLVESELDCVVAKHDLPDGTGVDLFDRVRRLSPDAACILFSAVDLAEIDAPGAGEPIIENVDAAAPAAHERLHERVDSATRSRHHAAYPVPTDEPDRLAAIAATRPLQGGPDLDRLVDDAADGLSAPIALVGIVEAHHERLLATRGVDWEQLHRQDTVCAHAICEEGVTVVEDIAADPRFTRSEPLSEHGIRAYAGAPIADAQGQVLGMLCVLDERPRTFTEGERAELTRLARAVARHLGIDGTQGANA